MFHKNKQIERKTIAKRLSSVQIHPALKYGEKINIEGNKYLMSFFFNPYFIFKLSPIKKGKSNEKCKFINLYTSSNMNIFLKIINKL